MATLTYSKTWVNGEVVTHTDLNNNFGNIKTLLETTKLDTSNLSAPKSNENYVFAWLGTAASGTSKVFRFAVPANVTFEPTAVNVGFTAVSSGTPTVSVQGTDDGTNILSATLTNATADTVATSTSIAQTSIGGNSVIKITVSVSGGDATDITVCLHGKTTHRS